jgi:hypothetical protein
MAKGIVHHVSYTRKRAEVSSEEGGGSVFLRLSGKLFVCVHGRSCVCIDGLMSYS